MHATHTDSNPPLDWAFLEGLPMPSVLRMGCVTAFELQAQHACDLRMPASEEHLLLCRTKHKSLVRCEVEGRTVSGDTLPGELTLVPAGQSSNWSLSGPQHTVCLLIGSSAIAEASRSAHAEGSPSPAWPGPCLRKAAFASDPSLHRLAVSLYGEMQSRDFAGEVSVDALTRLLAVHLIRRYSNARTEAPPAAGLPPHRLRLVLDYIARNYTRNLELCDLAALVKMTPYYFLRLFKKSTGKTPHQYLLHTRIERAKELLLADRMSLAEISLEMGFSNQSHFGTTFRRLTGVTPKVFQLKALCGREANGAAA